MLQRPLELGADVVVYSATKHIDGQGRCLGGVVLGSKTYVKDHLQDFLRQTGPSLSPFNAWVHAQGPGDAAAARARAMRRRRPRSPTTSPASQGVTRVLYCGRADHPQAALAKRQMTGFGQMVAFEIEGGKAAAFRFLNALRLIKISNNLGDAKSLITHPATTTHQRLEARRRARSSASPTACCGFRSGSKRPSDLAADIDRALAALRIG